MLFFVIYSSLLTAVVIYDTLLLFKLNMNTFYTHIFVFSHDSSVLVKDGEIKRSITFIKVIELSK